MGRASANACAVARMSTAAGQQSELPVHLRGTTTPVKAGHKDVEALQQLLAVAGAGGGATTPGAMEAAALASMLYAKGVVAAQQAVVAGAVNGAAAQLLGACASGGEGVGADSVCGLGVFGAGAVGACPTIANDFASLVGIAASTVASSGAGLTPAVFAQLLAPQAPQPVSAKPCSLSETQMAPTLYTQQAQLHAAATVGGVSGTPDGTDVSAKTVALTSGTSAGLGTVPLALTPGHVVGPSAASPSAEAAIGAGGRADGGAAGGAASVASGGVAGPPLPIFEAAQLERRIRQLGGERSAAAAAPPPPPLPPGPAHPAPPPPRPGGAGGGLEVHAIRALAAHLAGCVDGGAGDSVAAAAALRAPAPGDGVGPPPPPPLRSAPY